MQLFRNLIRILHQNLVYNILITVTHSPFEGKLE